MAVGPQALGPPRLVLVGHTIERSKGRFIVADFLGVIFLKFRIVLDLVEHIEGRYQRAAAGYEIGLVTALPD